MSTWPPGFQSRTTSPDELKRAEKERKKQRKVRNVGGPTHWRPQKREWMGEQK